MPVAILHLPLAPDPPRYKDLADDVRRLMVEVLGTSEDHGQVIIYESATRSVHETRDRNFIFIELLMFSGRTTATKETLFTKLDLLIRTYLGDQTEDVFINIVEIDRHDWARNGKAISKLNLPY